MGNLPTVLCCEKHIVMYTNIQCEQHVDNLIIKKLFVIKFLLIKCTKYSLLYIFFALFLKGEFANFFIGLSNAPKYDIYLDWIENDNFIDCFLSELLTFRVCPALHVLDTL